jgi:hypothetical protein
MSNPDDKCMACGATERHCNRCGEILGSDSPGTEHSHFDICFRNLRHRAEVAEGKLKREEEVFNHFYSDTRPDMLYAFPLERWLKVVPPYKGDDLTDEDLALLTVEFQARFHFWSLFIQRYVANDQDGLRRLLIIHNYTGERRLSSHESDKKIPRDEEEKMRAFVDGFIKSCKARRRLREHQA